MRTSSLTPCLRWGCIQILKTSCHSLTLAMSICVIRGWNGDFFPSEPWFVAHLYHKLPSPFYYLVSFGLEESVDVKETGVEVPVLKLCSNHRKLIMWEELRGLWCQSPLGHRLSSIKIKAVIKFLGILLVDGDITNFTDILSKLFNIYDKWYMFLRSKSCVGVIGQNKNNYGLQKLS